MNLPIAPSRSSPLDCLLDSSQGLPSNQIHRIARDQRARIWLATPGGLSCFDGTFVHSWDRSNGLLCNGLRSVSIDDAQRVWIGTDLGFDMLDAAGKPQPVVAPGSWNYGLCQDIVFHGDFVWMGCATGLVKLARLPVPDCFAVAFHADVGFVSDVVVLGEQRVIAASANAGLIETDGRQWWPYRCEAVVGRRVTRVVASFNGEIIVGMEAGLLVLDDERKQVVAMLEVPGTDPQVTAIAIGHDQYWAAAGSTLVNVSCDGPRRVVVEEFKADSTINDLLVDPLGNVFIATNSSGLAVVSFLRDAIERLDLGHQDGVYAIKHQREDEYLIGSERTLGRIGLGPQAGGLQPVAPGLPETIVWDALDEEAGSWAATQAGLFHAPRGESFAPAFADDPVLGAPGRVLLRRGDAIWAGSLRGLVAIRDGTSVAMDGAGMPLGYIYALHTDSQQALWVCTLGRGLWRELGGLAPIRTEHLTDIGNTYAISEGPAGRFVVLQDEKVVLLERDLTTRLVAELSPIVGWTACWIDAQTVAIGASDGLRIFDLGAGHVTSRINALMRDRDWEFTNNRTLVRDRQGRFLCGVSGGLVRVDHEKLRKIQPPVCQLVDVQWVGVEPERKGNETRLRPGRWSFRARVCAAWFVDTKGVRYQFQLVGFDASWSAPAARAEATYNSLPPGRYRLIARASSLLSGSGPELELLRFNVDVPFWGIGWLALFAGIEAGYVRLVRSRGRNRALLEQNLELQRAVDERTNALVKANAALEIVRDELMKLSQIDELTKLGNRRKFEQEFERSIALTRRLDLPLALLIIDIDHFKAVNDRLGHPVGDEYLRAVGRVLADEIRDGEDVATRFGGEEFAVLLVNSDTAGAAVTAERIRAAVEALALRNEGSSYGIVTVSIGIAVASRTHPLGSEELLVCADRALYRAKDGGRNRVVADQ